VQVTNHRNLRVIRCLQCPENNIGPDAGRLTSGYDKTGMFRHGKYMVI
jgi:hypothetical protein